MVTTMGIPPTIDRQREIDKAHAASMALFGGHIGGQSESEKKFKPPKQIEPGKRTETWKKRGKKESTLPEDSYIRYVWRLRGKFSVSRTRFHELREEAGLMPIGSGKYRRRKKL